MQADHNKIVITGRVGSGKSTLLRGLALFAEDLGLPYFAVFTPEIREGKKRAGFSLERICFNPKLGDPPLKEETPLGKIKHLTPLAQLFQPPGDQRASSDQHYRVGRYLVDPNVVGDIIVTLQAILHGTENTLIFLDEVGPMHLKHPQFLPTVQKMLDSKIPAYITLAEGTDPAVKDKIRNHPSVETFALTRENRDALLNTFIAQLIDQAARE